MRALILHFSGIIGLLVFLNQLWNAAAIEHTFVLALGTGLGIYVVLMVGYLVVYRIVKNAPPQAEDEEESSSEADGKEQAMETEAVS